MKIFVPVAAYHEYNTAVYVEAALRQLGHEAKVITQAEFYEDIDADLFIGVDSAGGLNFPEKHRGRSAMWFIDSRHNNDPTRRNPDDDTNARLIADWGGWVFQAQKEDWERNVSQGVVRSSWLPLAADPDVWCPYEAGKQHDVGFCGNVWDAVRQRILEEIAGRFSLNHVVGTPTQGAQGYSASRIGFNISSFFGSAVAYDVNMRVFEVMACGVPLLTNELPAMAELGFVNGFHYVGFNGVGGVLEAIQRLLDHGTARRASMGREARQFILEGHTYIHRMAEALEVLEAGGLCG